MSKTLIELLSVQFKFFLQQFFVNNLVVCPMYIQGFVHILQEELPRIADSMSLEELRKSIQ